MNFLAQLFQELTREDCVGVVTNGDDNRIMIELLPMQSYVSIGNVYSIDIKDAFPFILDHDIDNIRRAMNNATHSNEWVERAALRVVKNMILDFEITPVAKNPQFDEYCDNLGRKCRIRRINEAVRPV